MASAEREKYPVTFESTRKMGKICGVCGDRARCYHFGGLCCESCKAFFRRSVVKNVYRKYHCVHGGHCQLDVVSRKKCSHCRLDRCLSIGMDKKWLASEQMKAETKMKLAMKSQLQDKTINLPTENGEKENLHHSEEESSAFQTLVDSYHQVVNLIQFPQELNQVAKFTVVDMAAMFILMLKRCVCFSQTLQQFRNLNLSDQTVLLKSGIMEMVVLLGALAYDPVVKKFTGRGNQLHEHPSSPDVTADDLKLLHLETVVEKQIEIIVSILNLGADEVIILLMSAIALFTPDRISLQNKVEVGHARQHFVDLLNSYIVKKFGPDYGETMFYRFLMKFPVVRQVNDMHQVSPLSLSRDQMTEVENRLMKYQSDLTIVQVTSRTNGEATGDHRKTLISQIKDSFLDVIENPQHLEETIPVDYQLYAKLKHEESRHVKKSFNTQHLEETKPVDYQLYAKLKNEESRHVKKSFSE